MSLAPNLAARHAEALDWLYGRINYERVAVVPYGERQLKLDRMRQLLMRLGSPDKGQRIVHIAGTKGKGSTAAMVASMLRQAGRCVGVYSSPHLERVEERFAVDGEPCSPAELVALVDHVRPVVEAMDAERDTLPEEVSGLTFFDITTAMSLVLFVDRGVDTTVLEVGLGGRLDSTNVCHPVVTAVTSIGLDHTKQLGDTLEAIAAEKAGIIKPGVPVVCGETAAGPQAVIAQIAREHGSRLIQRGVDYTLAPSTKRPQWETPPSVRQRYHYQSLAGELASVELGLDGDHQSANAATALAIIDELNQQGWRIGEQARLTGLAETRLPARVEWFPGEPRVVVDAAHNAPSAAALAAAVAAQSDAGGRTLLLALSRDKDGAAIVRELTPVFDRFVVTQYLENARAVAPDQVAALVKDALTEQQRDLPVHVCETPTEAWRVTLEQTPKRGVVAATGSFFLAAEVRPMALTWSGLPAVTAR